MCSKSAPLTYISIFEFLFTASSLTLIRSAFRYNFKRIFIVPNQYPKKQNRVKEVKRHFHCKQGAHEKHDEKFGAEFFHGSQSAGFFLFLKSTDVSILILMSYHITGNLPSQGVAVFTIFGLHCITQKRSVVRFIRVQKKQKALGALDFYVKYLRRSSIVRLRLKNTYALPYSTN